MCNRVFKGLAMADRQEPETEWTGHDLYDKDGDKVGTIEDVRYGEKTIGLKWLVVESGLFGMKKIVVPATEVESSGGRLVVPYDKAKLKDAPGFKHDWTTMEEEQNVCSYYGLDYAGSLEDEVEGCVESEAQRQAT